MIIFHSVREFEELHHRLLQEYGRGVMLISWRMKSELGFTIRRHKGLAPIAVDGDWLEEEFKHQYHYEPQVHLDFYNEAQLTWFVLKYLTDE